MAGMLQALQVLQARPARRRCVLAAYALPALMFLAWPAHSAMAAPAAQHQPPAAVARFSTVNIHSRPEGDAPVVGAIAYGEGCTAIGRDTVTGWWLVQCSPTMTGWVAHDSVNIVGDLAAIPWFTVDSPPAASLPASPVEESAPEAWRALYFANRELAGTPVLRQAAPELHFDWGFGSPGPAVPADHFSARYERMLALHPGSYRLTLRMDDGARLFVDDQLVLDDWRVGPVRELTAVRPLGSSTRVRVEYFEESGAAAVSFTYTPLDASVAVTPAPSSAPGPDWDLPLTRNLWRTQFFNNTDLGGSPAVVQDEPRSVYPLEHNWGLDAPAAGIGPDFWSARFAGRFHLAAGDYEFFAVSDDGVRVYVDDILVIDAWFDGHNDRRGRFDKIGGGWHTIRVEYYARTGSADVRVWWALAGSSQPPAGPLPPPL